jgi:hypothetical protein
MTKLGRLAVILAGSILASSLAGGASAQGPMARDWDSTRDWRDRAPERGPYWRDNRRDRDYDWDRSSRWQRRGPDCHFETRRVRDRFGDVIVRRYRVCEY